MLQNWKTLAIIGILLGLAGCSGLAPPQDSVLTRQVSSKTMPDGSVVTTTREERTVAVADPCQKSLVERMKFGLQSVVAIAIPRAAGDSGVNQDCQKKLQAATAPPTVKTVGDEKKLVKATKKPDKALVKVAEANKPASATYIDSDGYIRSSLTRTTYTDR